MKKLNHNFDNHIKKLLQSEETRLDIPDRVDRDFLDRLEHASPKSPRREYRNYRNYIYAGTLAAAASILLVGFLLLFNGQGTEPVNPAPAPDLKVTNKVLIDFAKLEGMPANTYIISPPDSNMTIVWVEKSHVMAEAGKTGGFN